MLNTILAISVLIFIIAFAHGKEVVQMSISLNQQEGKKTVQKNQNSQNATNIIAGNNARITVQQGQGTVYTSSDMSNFAYKQK